MQCLPLRGATYTLLFTFFSMHGINEHGYPVVTTQRAVDRLPRQPRGTLATLAAPSGYLAGLGVLSKKLGLRYPRHDRRGLVQVLSGYVDSGGAVVLAPQLVHRSGFRRLFHAFEDTRTFPEQLGRSGHGESGICDSVDIVHHVRMSGEP